MASNTKELNIRTISHGNLTGFQPLFSSDGELLFVVIKNIIRVFGATTGTKVRDLCGLENDIVGFDLDINNPKILVACSLSGEVIFWKWNSGSADKKIKLEIPFNNFKISNFKLFLGSNKTTNCIITWSYPAKIETNINYFDLTESSPTLKNFNNNEKTSFWSKKKKIKIAVSVKFDYIALIQMKCLLFIDLLTDKTNYHKLCQELTTITCHPNEKLLITGTSMGIIFIWRNLDERPVRTINHWHQSIVKTTAFSVSGSYFYSGGEERVVVRHSLNDQENNDYISRLPSSIAHVAVSMSNTLIAICLESNEIQILNANKNKVATIQSTVRLLEDRSRVKFPIGLKRNPRTNELVSNGCEGHLQFFSTRSKSVLYNMDIVNENFITDCHKLIYNTQITGVAFSMEWMVTAESRNDPQKIDTTKLKFWYFDQENQKYSLNTLIKSNDNNISEIQLSSAHSVNNLLCATAGSDNYIKLWSIQEIEEKFSWSLTGKLNYKNFTILSIGFSQDGSLLSAGAGNALCVWSVNNMKLKCLLSAPAALDGCINKISISLPVKLKKNNKYKKQIVKEDSVLSYENSVRKKKMVEQIKLLLETNDSSIITNLRMDPKVTSKTLNGGHKLFHKSQLLFEQIMSVQELNINDKIELFLKFNINHQSPNKLKQSCHRIRKKLKDNIEIIGNKLDTKNKYLIRSKLKRFVIRLRDKMATQNSSYSKTLPYLTKTELLTNLKKTESKEVEIGKKKMLNEGVQDNEEHLIKSIAQITHVRFGTGEYSHLVVVCTMNRLLIWNLFTLRLQTALKMSIREIVVDPFTNLFAAFTYYNDLYVFLPNVPMPIYHRKDIPPIYGAIWIPRSIQKNVSINIDWQSSSQLLFLDNNQELLYLISDDDIDDTSISFINLHGDKSLKTSNSPFGEILAKKIEETSKTLSKSYNNNPFTSIGVPGTTVVKKIIGLASHTMPPISQLSTEFIKSLLIVESKNETKYIQENNFIKQNGNITNDDSDDDENKMDVDVDQKIQQRIKNQSKIDLYENVTGRNTNLVQLSLENKLREIAKETFNLKL